MLVSIPPGTPVERAIDLSLFLSLLFRRSSSLELSGRDGTKPIPSRSLFRTSPPLEEVPVELLRESGSLSFPSSWTCRSADSFPFVAPSEPRNSGPTSSSSLTTTGPSLPPLPLGLEGPRREEDTVLEEVEEE